MAQLGDNSSGDKEKEGTKTETRVKEELKDEEPDDQWGGAPQDSGTATAKAPRR